MLRKIVENDRELFLEMMDKFYNSEAVTEKIDPKNYETTFKFLVAEDPYVDGYMLEDNGITVGYCLLSITYSNEVGGYVTWLEELYIDNKYQNKGLGKKAMSEINKKFSEKTKAFRLEVSPENIALTDFYKKYGYNERVYIQMYNPNEE